MKIKQLHTAFLITIMAVFLSACGSSDDADDNMDNQTQNNNNNENNRKTDANDGDVSLGDKDIELPYVEWSGCVASTHVMQQVLEDNGYNVETTPVDKGPMYASVADESADAHTCTWLPTNGGEVWEEYKDQLIKVNTTIDVAPIGLAVPEYMDIDSIEDLKDNEELGEDLDWEITGHDPGSGTMEVTEDAIEEYGLDEWDLISSSEGAMLGRLQQAIKDKEPIVVTLWKPHYAFGKWDLKMLDDPEKTYGEPDSISTSVSEALEEESPAAYKILSQFDWDYDMMNEVMVDIEDGKEPSEAAEMFVENHPDLVEEWTE